MLGRSLCIHLPSKEEGCFAPLSSIGCCAFTDTPLSHVERLISTSTSVGDKSQQASCKLTAEGFESFSLLIYHNQRIAWHLSQIEPSKHISVTSSRKHPSLNKPYSASRALISNEFRFLQTLGLGGSEPLTNPLT